MMFRRFGAGVLGIRIIATGPRAFYAIPEGTTLGGLSSPLTFPKGKTFDNACYFLMGIKNQKLDSLNGSKDFCVKL